MHLVQGTKQIRLEHQKVEVFVKGGQAQAGKGTEAVSAGREVFSGDCLKFKYFCVVICALCYLSFTA